MSVALTPGESKMLTAVVFLMGDVPDIDFNALAPLVNQKYARNARSSCKKLFDKIKANSTPLAEGVNVKGADSDEQKPAVKKAAAGKVIKKGTAKVVKKAVASRPAPGAKGKKAVKEEAEEDEDEKFKVEGEDEGEGYDSDEEHISE